MDRWLLNHQSFTQGVVNFLDRHPSVVRFWLGHKVAHVVTPAYMVMTAPENQKEAMLNKLLGGRP